MPILNVHFLYFLIKNFNTYKASKIITDINPFGLNISLLNLSSISSKKLIDEYETALTFSLNITSTSNFNFQTLLDFLAEN